MISAFGKFIRSIRGDESLRTMAKRLDITPAFLSAMEVGRKNIPMTYVDKISELYDLNEDQKAELFNSIVETNKHVDIEIEKMNEAQKETTMAFARKIESADPELLEKLRNVLIDKK